MFPETSLFEVKDPHHTVVEGCWPTSLDEGRGTAGEELEGAFVGILVESKLKVEF